MNLCQLTGFLWPNFPHQLMRHADVAGGHLPLLHGKGKLAKGTHEMPGFQQHPSGFLPGPRSFWVWTRPRYSEPHCDCKRSSSTMVAGDPWELPWTTKTILQKVHQHHQPSHNRWVRPVWPAHFPGSCSSNLSLPATVGVLLYCYTDPQKIEAISTCLTRKLGTHQGQHCQRYAFHLLGHFGESSQPHHRAHRHSLQGIQQLGFSRLTTYGTWVATTSFRHLVDHGFPSCLEARFQSSNGFGSTILALSHEVSFLNVKHLGHNFFHIQFENWMF